MTKGTAASTDELGQLPERAEFDAWLPGAVERGWHNDTDVAWWAWQHQQREIERLRSDRDLEKKWRKDAEHDREELIVAAVAAERERICLALPGGWSVDPQWVADMVRDGPKLPSPS